LEDEKVLAEVQILDDVEDVVVKDREADHPVTSHCPTCIAYSFDRMSGY
jgi:hypothetical protein